MKRLYANIIGYFFGAAYISFTFISFSWLWFLIAVTLALSGCTQIATFTAEDANNALVMATKDTADPQASSRAGCYQAWSNLAGGIARLPANTTGIFTGVEAGIEVQGTLQLPACQAIAGQVMLWAIRKAPGGNLLP